ncbi:MAG: hypothetical protein JWN70_751 [Planctomycetaceae bacterium]|nr:hypothetical protein [Planctomycetaceae bacterium]
MLMPKIFANRLTIAAIVVAAWATDATAQGVRVDYGSSVRVAPNGTAMLGVPKGLVMGGWHADNNRITGSQLLDSNGNVLVIGDAEVYERSERFGMLSTNPGWVAVGIHHDQSRLLQQPLPVGPNYRYYFSLGYEPWEVFSDMHVSRIGDAIVGVTRDHNVFTCVTTRVPPGMENEPLNPTVVDVYIDLMRCDKAISDGEIAFGIGDTRDEIRVHVNGVAIDGDNEDYFPFHSVSEMGPHRSNFVSNKGRDYGPSLKLGTVTLDGANNRYLALTLVEQGPDQKRANEMLDKIGQAAGSANQESKDNGDKSSNPLLQIVQVAAQVAKLLITAKETRVVGTSIVALRVEKDGLRAEWASGDRNTLVTSVLERQARVHMGLDAGHYWLQLRVVPR